ncbi:MAG TPA: LytTR family DNA-binding domain-containing protein [Allosphingosinicella sp.]
MERLRRIAIDLFLMVAIGTILGLVGPFGSASMQPGVRLLFWVGFVVAGYAIFRPVSAVSRWAAAETAMPLWLAVVLATLVASLPLTGLLALALGVLRPPGDWFGRPFPILFGQVATVGIAIRLLMMALYQRQEPVEVAASEREVVAEGAPAPPPSPSLFLRRLPPALGRDLLLLEMQDHYVRAETVLGSTLLLMRFRDAVEELGASGMQVHRSWWVAFGATEALEREGRSARLRLKGGGTVPVSRACLADVRAAFSEFDTPPPPGKSRGRDGTPDGEGITA